MDVDKNSTSYRVQGRGSVWGLGKRGHRQRRGGGFAWERKPPEVRTNGGEGSESVRRAGGM